MRNFNTASGMHKHSARKNFALLAAFFFQLLCIPSLAHSQCGGTQVPLSQYDVGSDFLAGKAENEAQRIDLRISDVSDAKSLSFDFRFLETLPVIDSVRLQWIDPALPNSTLSWWQPAGGSLLQCTLVPDECNPVGADEIRFQLIIYASDDLGEEWTLEHAIDGIVEVDVIQGKVGAREIQRIYSLEGVLLREVECFLNTSPDTKNLPEGIYLLARIRDGQVLKIEKVLAF